MVHNCREPGDGWTHATDEVRRFYEAVSVDPAAAGIRNGGTLPS